MKLLATPPLLDFGPSALKKSRLGKVFLATALFASVLIASSAAVSQPVASQTTSDIVFTAPTGLIVGRNRTLAIDASNSVADGSNTITCADPTGVDATKMTVTRGTGANACTFTVDPVDSLAPASQGDATFSVLFTSSGGDTETGTFTVNIGPDSNIRTVNIPNPLRFNSNVREHKLNFSRFATDGDYEIFCTSVTATLGTISNRAADSCIFDYRLSFAFGTSRFNVSFRSAGGSTTTTSFRFNITTATFLNSFNFPAQNVVVGSTTDLEAGNHISITAFYANNYFCFDPTNIDSKITVILRGCRYIITGVTAGTASFTVNFRVTDGAVRSAAVAVNVESIAPLSSADCSNGAFVNTTANPRVSGANNDLVEDCQALVAIHENWRGASANNDLPSGHFMRTWGTGSASERMIQNWSGVTVSGGRVTALNLSGLGGDGDGLSGSIADEIGSLTGLSVLDLSYNSLTGAIPTQIGSLTGLTILDLTDNQLSGSIPTQLGSLTSLTELDLSVNDLSGSIPSQLGSLTSVAVLNLSYNGLTGAIPGGLGSMAALEELWLNDNSLSGSIPTQLGSLVGVVEVYLDNNDLTGSIPAEVGDMASLEVLYLSNNKLTGSIPSDLGDLSELGELELSNNNLTGSIPSQIGDLSEEASGVLYLLGICGNQLTGAVPSDLRSESLLTGYPTAAGYNPIACQNSLSNIVYTAPTGLSVGIGRVLVIDAAEYAPDGNFTVSCAAATGVDSKITITNVGCSYAITPGSTAGTASFTVPYTSAGGDTENGTISVTITRTATGSPVVALDAGGCTDGTFVDTAANPRVSGANNDLVEDCQALVAIQNHWAAVAANRKWPSWQPLRNWGVGTTQKINNWPGVTVTNKRVTELALRQPHPSGDPRNSVLSIHGTLPAELSNLSALEGLLLNDNILIGDIPAELGNLTNLTDLYLFNNKLTGTIPTQLASPTDMIDLQLNDNQLTGTIPTQLGNLIDLEYLLLDDNRLSGSIPSQLGNLTELFELGLGNNLLTGTIPQQLSGLTTVESLRMQNNRLTGSIPTQLGSLSNNLLDSAGLDICDNYLTGAVPTALRTKLNDYPTASGYDPIACQNAGSPPTAASDITYTPPALVPIEAGRSEIIDALAYVNDDPYTITCADATGKTASLTSVTRDGCLYTITAGATAGDGSFTIPYTSSGTDTHSGLLNVKILPASAITYTPVSVQAATGGMTLVDVSSLASDGSYAVSCGDAKSIDSKLSSVTRTANTCTYTVTVGSTAGAASFVVPYASTGGAALDATVSITIVRPLSVIVFREPFYLDLATNQILTIDASDYASDAYGFTISCGDATGVDSKITIQRTGCSFVVTPTGATGTAVFTVPYTSSGGDTYNAVFAIDIGSASAISFTAPTGLTLGTNRSMTLDASSYATDASYLITCGDATGVDSKITVTRPNANARSCEYAITPTGATGTATFTVPYTSSGGHSTNGTISIAITTASAIVFTAPTGLSMTTGSSMTINAASYATDGSYTITCADAAARDAKIARITNTGCSYEITSGETTGTATFTVPYTSTGGHALAGQISVAITARARNVAPVFDRQSMMCGMLGFQPVRHSTADRITQADNSATFCRTPSGIICLRGSYRAETPNSIINAIGLETSLDSCYNSIS